LKKIAIISSHPIQYNAPLFKRLAEDSEIELMVFYTWGKDGAKRKFDPDFDKQIEWDLPLLEGYPYCFCLNVARDPGSHHFNGIKTPILTSQIEEWQPDVIWVWGWAFHSHLAILRHFKGKTKIWFRGDSTLLDEPSSFTVKKIIRKFFLKWVYGHVDKAFYVGTNNKNYFLKFGLNEHQLVNAPHAIDNGRFTERDRPKNSRPFHLLYVGKLEPRKNPFFLKKIMDNLNTTDFHLSIVGSGPLEVELKELLSINPNVDFLGFRNQIELPSIYSSVDLLVLPSLSETWGLAINEALACGTPVAASIYCGGAIDMINTDNGFLFDPKQGVECFIEKLENFRCQVKKEFTASFKDNFCFERIIEAVKANLN
jgi:glycosyltransferase involved in cell wall biosynthesis